MNDEDSAKDSGFELSTNRSGPERSFDRVPSGRSFVPWLAEMCRKRGFVTWLISYIGVSRSDLCYLARHNKIPGVAPAPNDYNRDWTKDPKALAAWIRKRRKQKKGNRKRRDGQKGELSEVERVTAAIRALNRLAGRQSVWDALRSASDADWRKIRLSGKTSILLAFIARRKLNES